MMQRGLEGRSKAYSSAVAELSPVPARVLPIEVSYIAVLDAGAFNLFLI